MCTLGRLLLYDLFWFRKAYLQGNCWIQILINVYNNIKSEDSRAKNKSKLMKKFFKKITLCKKYSHLRRVVFKLHVKSDFTFKFYFMYHII